MLEVLDEAGFQLLQLQRHLQRRSLTIDLARVGPAQLMQSREIQRCLSTWLRRLSTCARHLSTRHCCLMHALSILLNKKFI